MSLINHYSLLWFFLILFGIAAYRIFRKGMNPKAILLLSSLLLAFVAAWFFIRPTQSVPSQDASALEAEIGQGAPVLLELQSPY